MIRYDKAEKFRRCGNCQICTPEDDPDWVYCPLTNEDKPASSDACDSFMPEE